MTTAVEIKDFIKMAKDYMPEVVTLGVVTAEQLNLSEESKIKVSSQNSQGLKSILDDFYGGLMPSSIAIVTQEEVMRMENETRLAQKLNDSTPSLKKTGLKLK